MKSVMIIGATGVFGRRLAAHLAQFEGVSLILTSRDETKAQALAASLSPNAKGIALERSAKLAEQLAKHRPWAVIDCSGPFQTADYSVPLATLKAGAHYVDLADASGFLSGALLETAELARNAGVVAAFGASTTPGLSSAVVAELARNMQRVESIDIAVTPGGQGEVGDAVIKAVLSYAGRPVPVWRDGKLQHAVGWSGGASLNIEGLGKRRVALVETYDAELLGPRYEVRDYVRFRAGLEARIEQRGLETFSWIRRHGFNFNTEQLVRPLSFIRQIMRRLTSDKGAMVVEVKGKDATGLSMSKRWTLLARKGDGPNVPIMAAAAVIKRLLQENTEPGAYLAGDLVGLRAIEKQMLGYHIRCGQNHRSMYRHDQRLHKAA
ncbi:MAG: saccharopine dehydrogenase NADP-binding domain-containing protein [Pseudomonadota bacterium]